ncbi:retrovirus-related pol polyprotein from transposon TNT 1-94 [Tanacetum coccineum]|uniref:Retrovirus-related pol polyprotein from transposon TNT 1-94 n=1 Tax=Tanacetum coccineum TaxID=301880 RepID=A0ABQ5GR86_9ASTR
MNATPTVKIILNKGKQIWKPKGKLSDNSLKKANRVWKETGKLFANVGYQWRPIGKKFSLGKLNCGYQWRPTGKKFALGEQCPLTKLPVKCHTGRPLVSGFRLFKTYDGETFQESQNFVWKISPGQQFWDSDLKLLSEICLLSKASKIKSWMWHRRLNHLNFDTINDLAQKDLVRGLPRLKFEKDHLCSTCQLEKARIYSQKPKTENTNMEVLHTLHMIYVVQKFVINFLKQIQVSLNKTIRYIRTDNAQNLSTKVCLNTKKVLAKFHHKDLSDNSSNKTDVTRRGRNCTLVEAARTMLIFSKAPMFLWAEVVV